MEQKKSEVTESEVSAAGTNDTAVAVAQAPEPQRMEGEADAAGTRASRKKVRKVKADLTLAGLAERYLAHMEETGKSSGTLFSYKLELVTAMNELGGKTRLADLTREKVGLFFASYKVNKTRTGRPKSPLSIAKTQRVLRLALVWAVSAKLIETAPLPEEVATR